MVEFNILPATITVTLVTRLPVTSLMRIINSMTALADRGCFLTAIHRFVAKRALQALMLVAQGELGLLVMIETTFLPRLVRMAFLTPGPKAPAMNIVDPMA